jgi:hypothetical protein
MSPIVTVLVSGLTGGLAGAFLTVLVTPWIQKLVMRRQLRAQSRREAMSALGDWLSKAHELYMLNEGSGFQGDPNPPKKSSMYHPELLRRRFAVEGAIQVLFGPTVVREFQDLGDFIDDEFAAAFRGDGQMNFALWHEKRDRLLADMYEELWCNDAKPKTEE